MTAPARVLVTASLVLGLIGLFGLAGLAGCSDNASEDECTKLLDHLIDIEVNAAATGKLSPERQSDLAKQKAEVAEYLREEFIKKCKTESPGARVRCGLKAKTPEELAACDKE